MQLLQLGTIPELEVQELHQEYIWIAEISRQSNEPRSILPIVISMINKCFQQQEGSFSLFDMKITNVSDCEYFDFQVSVYGLLTNCVEGTGGSKDYTIHDGTGSISGKSYMASEENMYCFSHMTEEQHQRICESNRYAEGLSRSCFSFDSYDSSSRAF